MGKRIVIMAGGTGGHVFPALAVAQSLAEKGWQVSWLGTRKGLESRVVPENGIEIDWLSVSGVRGKGIMAKLKAVLMLAKACMQALRVLRRRKPDVVLGMGGFVAGPGGLMAKLLGIPLIIHEQNRVPGTTNRLLAKIANRILEAFPDSFSKEVKAECTGNPLRKQFLSRLDDSGRRSNQAIHILVVGGSQGAQILNEVVPEAVRQLKDVKIKHQTGTAMFEQVKSRYEALGVNADVSAFIDDMVSAYQWADMVICRAGAMTVSEVAALGVPAIFIPLPHAIDDHQTANARYLTDAGAGICLMQKDLNAATLAEQITRMLKQLDAMSKTAKQCARLDATEVVAGYCMTEAGL
ncbi:undecaprenyldiphospho-muramoylpentapeptide beta-N-acetylglucosaminyltransferase [Methylobacter sp. YRD-M1]|uniref:undecaprenyldiphospho-muramoylpentapeptide beta-N-acetylglucosaminyltransferase n=1 Tax=Methylobacter sp. YRD-M1 TaxID=2911520 RepID=UPI00227C1471|nr:undecaprenyldiphospho-muramoylpentapeptide beta-N-acetylglucosaminyltransferase [Methylobacter sp. YRD-M1]WAK02738.1 undecaprenyldiphospho-muramoylpentapeptide beta-N-acetylglucosaminyltransferase [Methylobacter sp. YRD-M1]